MKESSYRGGEDLPDSLKDDLEMLASDFGITAIEMMEEGYYVKLKDQEQRFQSANLKYDSSGSLENASVIPNIGENFSKAREYEEELKGLLE